MSLLLCVASVWAWLRSYRVIDIVYSTFGTNDIWHAQTNGGTVLLERFRAHSGTDENRWLAFPLPSDEVGDLHYPGTGLPLAAMRTVPKKRFGIRLYQWSDYQGGTATASVTPLRIPAAATGALPLFRCALWLTSALRSWSRRRRGWCPKCGYDLRATPDHCPECGNVPRVASCGQVRDRMG
jgi:hypothetical protein